MVLFYVLSFFKTGDTIQGGTLFKGGHYSREDIIKGNRVNCIDIVQISFFIENFKTKYMSDNN